MPAPPSIIERAFELAKSGEYATVSEIKKQLDAEHYSSTTSYLQGSSLTGQLRRLIFAAKVKTVD